MAVTTSLSPGDMLQARNGREKRMWHLGAVALSAFFLLTFVRRTRAAIPGFQFDDALIFYRYVMNFRHGFGLAWNPGEGHVFGLTSLPWTALVWAASFLPLSPVAAVVVLSSLVGVAALVALAWLCASQMRLLSFSGLLVVFPVVALPLILQRRFCENMTNGMETMLGLLSVTLFIGVLHWSMRKNTGTSIVLLAATGVMLGLVRPEALLVSVLLPCCMVVALNITGKVRFLSLYLTCVVGLLGAFMGFAELYFGSLVPLPFYLKWLHSYKGFLLYLNPFAYTAFFLSIGGLPLLVIAVLARGRHLKLLAAYWIPLAAVLLYLFTVNQIMGLNARYYVPFLPLLYVPAAFIAGDWQLGQGILHVKLTARRAGLIAVVFLLVAGQVSESFYIPLANVMVRRRIIYSEPEFSMAATKPLPALSWWESCHAVGALARALPAGRLISASEVGLVGVLAPHVRILDSAGLNDPEIAHSGFSTDYLLGKKPDLIWLLHSDYTQDYGKLASDPKLLEQYTLYGRAFQYGLAIRKDSPYRDVMTHALEGIWAHYYPGSDKDAFVVEQVRWNPAPIRGSKQIPVIAP